MYKPVSLMAIVGLSFVWLAPAVLAETVQPSADKAPAVQALPAPIPTANTFYRITDPDGTVRFTDQYVEGAEQITLGTSEPSARSRAEHAVRQSEQARTDRMEADYQAHCGELPALAR